METGDLTSSIARLNEWLKEKALPFWAETALDPDGGWFEDLTPEGKPRKDQIRRVRVQPRQAYVYAHAAALGWLDKAQELSDHGFSYLLDKAAIGDPLNPETFDGFVHRLHPDGSIADDRRDTYDHAFVLLACAWRIKAFDDHRSRKVAAATLAFLDRACGQEDGSFFEGHPHQVPRRQNPHMHLFEAFMALADATGEDAYLIRAKQIFDLFQQHFYDAEQHILREFFEDDWTLCRQKGHLIEPGHMVEWVWLLDQYAQLTRMDVSDLSSQLFSSAINHGQGGFHGLLTDTVSLDPTRTTSPTHRTWVQTEHIKAALVGARKGNISMTAKAAALIDQLFRIYLPSNIAGGYVDRLGPNGKILSEAMPASTLYHLMSLGAEAEKTARALG